MANEVVPYGQGEATQIPSGTPEPTYTNPDFHRSIYEDSDTAESYKVGIYGLDSFRSIAPKGTYDGSDDTEIP